MSVRTSTTLSEVITLQRGHDLPATIRGDGTVPVIGSFGVTGYHDVAKYAGPGVAIGRSGASIGVATYVDQDYWPLNTALFVKDFKANDPRWVYFLLDSIDFTAYNSGSAQPSLNRNYLALIDVSLPSYPEQRVIAATLGSLDDKIESNRRAISLSEQLMDALSEQSGAELPRIALSELTDSHKESINPTKLQDTLVRHYSLPAFDDGAQPERTSASTIKSNKLVVPRDAILISRLNPRFNRTWWVSGSDDNPALASTEFLVLTASDELSLAGLWLALRDEHFRTELPRRVTGTSGSHQRVRPDDLLAIEVPDVRLLDDEAKRQALALLRRVDQLRSEISRLTALRDQLLPELLSGRIRVPVEGAAA